MSERGSNRRVSRGEGRGWIVSSCPVENAEEGGQGVSGRRLQESGQGGMLHSKGDTRGEGRRMLFREESR